MVNAHSLVIILLFLFLIIPVTSAQNEFSKFKGIMSDWHKAKICIPCHINTLPPKELNRFLNCPACHSKKISDPQVVEELHTVDVCVKCHAGSSLTINSLKTDDYHRIHKDVNCRNCHGESTVIRPPSKVCFDCHEGKFHGVHGRILDEICVSCHSDRIYSYTGEVPPEITKKPTPVPPGQGVETKETSLSLADLIFRLISKIFGL